MTELSTVPPSLRCSAIVNSFHDNTQPSSRPRTRYLGSFTTGRTSHHRHVKRLLIYYMQIAFIQHFSRRCYPEMED